jgi:hypothetical protein
VHLVAVVAQFISSPHPSLLFSLFSIGGPDDSVLNASDGHSCQTKLE